MSDRHAVRVCGLRGRAILVLLGAALALAPHAARAGAPIESPFLKIIDYLLGRPSPFTPEDINGDGIIDLADLILVVDTAPTQMPSPTATPGETTPPSPTPTNPSTPTPITSPTLTTTPSTTGSPTGTPSPTETASPTATPTSTPFNPSRAELVSQTGGSISRAAIQGTRAIYGEGPRLRVMNISDPSSPTEIGAVLLPGAVASVALSGDLALAAAWYDGLQIVSLSDPASPAIVGSIQTENLLLGGREAVLAVGVSGHVAYVGGQSGLHVIDISDPAAPAILTTVAAELVASLDISDSLLAIASVFNGVQFFDISSPSAPAPLGALPSVGPFSVTLADSKAIVGGFGGGIEIVDITDPAAPVPLGQYTLSDRALFYPAVSGGLAFIPWTTSPIHPITSGMDVVDISNPAQPVQIARYFGDVRELAITDDTAVIAGYWSVSTADLSGPTPTRLWDRLGLGRADQIIIEGARAITEDFTLSLSDPAAPAALGRLQVEGLTTMNGDMVYAATGYDFAVLDISNPSAPAPRGALRYSQTGQALDTDHVGATALIAHGSDVIAISAQNPDAPSVITNLGGFGQATALAVSGSMVYVADRDTRIVKAYDFENPAQPKAAGELTPTIWPEDLSLEGGLLCVAGFWSEQGSTEYGFQILNVATSPWSVEGEYRAAAQHLYAGPSWKNISLRIAISGPAAYVGFGASGIHAVDISASETPMLRWRHDTGGAIGGLDYADGLLHVADQFGGLVILHNAD